MYTRKLDIYIYIYCFYSLTFYFFIYSSFIFLSYKIYDPVGGTSENKNNGTSTATVQLIKIADK